MVNEESSAKSLHFMVEKGAKPTVRMFMNILKAYMRHRHEMECRTSVHAPQDRSLFRSGRGRAL